MAARVPLRLQHTYRQITLDDALQECVGRRPKRLCSVCAMNVEILITPRLYVEAAVCVPCHVVDRLINSSGIHVVIRYGSEFLRSKHILRKRDAVRPGVRLGHRSQSAFHWVSGHKPKEDAHDRGLRFASTRGLGLSDIAAFCLNVTRTKEFGANSHR